MTRTQNRLKTMNHEFDRQCWTTPEARAILGWKGLATLQMISDGSTVRCYDGSSLLLTLDACEGGHDIKAMETAGLEPSNEADCFTYANHLLGNQFKAFKWNVI